MANFVTLQEIREQSGFQYKERGESLGEGDGSTVLFTVENKPIVDRNYSGTPVSTADIVVYVSKDAVSVLSASPITGQLALASAPASGSPITVDYDWSPVDVTVLQHYADEAHDLVITAIAEVYSVPLSETPKMLKLIEKRLAAGLILDKEYSVGGDETEDSRGRRWVKWAEQKLEDIKSGKITLFTSAGVALSQGTAEVDGWPDDTTEDALEEDSGGDIRIRGKKEF